MAQGFAAEVPVQNERNQTNLLRREALYQEWKPALDAIEIALNRLAVELLNCLTLSKSRSADVYVLRHRLTFDWQSEQGRVRVSFEPTVEGVYYRVLGEKYEGYCRDLVNNYGSLVYSAPELACGIVIERLRKLILPKLL